MSNNSKMAQHRAIHLQWPTNRKSYDLSIGAILIDLEGAYPSVSRSRHSLALNISETIRDTDSFNEILIGTFALLNSVISNDF